jgi:hypothetical protein
MDSKWLPGQLSVAILTASPCNSITTSSPTICALRSWRGYPDRSYVPEDSWASAAASFTPAHTVTERRFCASLARHPLWPSPFLAFTASSRRVSWLRRGANISSTCKRSRESASFAFLASMLTGFMHDCMQQGTQQPLSRATAPKQPYSVHDNCALSPRVSISEM